MGSEDGLSSIEKSTMTTQKIDHVDRYAPFVVRGAILTAGIAGALMFARSIRLFTRFEHVRDIPRDFMDKQFRLNGTIKGVTDDGGLRVLHRPILRIPQLRASAKLPGLLTVRMAALEVSDVGACWLRENIGEKPKPVWFTLIKPTYKLEDSVDCEIIVKRNRLPFKYSLNQEMIRRGLARIPGVDVSDHLRALRTVPAYSRLVNQLLLSEKVADRMGVGMWKRQTWVEGIRSFPSQAKDMVVNSTAVKAGQLMGESGKNVAIGLPRFCLIIMDWYYAQTPHKESDDRADGQGTSDAKPNEVEEIFKNRPNSISGHYTDGSAASSPVMAKRKIAVVKPPGSDSPLLLSPILARPAIARSLSAQPHAHIWRNASESEAELLGYLTSSPSPTRIQNDRSVPASPVPFPRSASAARLQLFTSGGLTSPSPVLRAGIMLNRAESDAADRRRLSIMHRRLSTAVTNQWTVPGPWHLSIDSPPSGSMSNLLRLKNSNLGHSCPQLSPLTCGTIPTGPPAASYPAVKLRKELRIKRRHSHRLSGRSFNASSTSPMMPPRCRSPSRTTQVLVRPTSAQRGEPGLLLAAPGHPRTAALGGRPTLNAPAIPDTRRWSVASLPSSSGYGTPGSNSGLSSQYSSQERLAMGMEELRISTQSQQHHRFDSNDSYPGVEDFVGIRPRSRSLNSPVKSQHDTSIEMTLRSNVYKDKFPKAKQQMEERLERFVNENTSISGPVAYTSEDDGQSSSESTDPLMLRVLADGSTRFLHHQIVELANDCLMKSRDDMITSSYFCDMSQSLEDTVCEAREKTPPESFAFLSNLVKRLLIMVARPARLLECLEFDPEEFYQLLEEAEGQVREQLGSQVPDLPQYIVGKLGLDKDPLAPEKTPPFMSESPDLSAFDFSESSTAAFSTELMGPQGLSAQAPKLPTDRPPKEDDFDAIKLISNGAYGAVYLVRHRETRQRFALKKLNKSNLALRNQIEQVFAERDILTFIDNPFVVSFYGSFETKRHLCMLMEYVEGGDCATLLKNAAVLPVDLARLYIAETVLAIEYLHSYGIVHRDLKPDNLLITAMGHIKLTDFGLSKIGLMNRTTLLYEGYLDVSDTQQFQDKQLCGTPEYIAPEVILRQGYGKPVDWWALGIILYEFLCGTVPFFGDTTEELFAHVVSDEIEFPEEPYDPPEEAKDLVHQLLTQNPLERIGTLNGAAEIRLHPFFIGLCWATVLRQKAEFVPNLDSEEDTSYFDTRAERYNHEVESGEDDGSEESGSGSPMFWSFSSCASPRHSIVALDPSILQQVSPGNTDTQQSGRKCSEQSQSSITSSQGNQSEESAESGIALTDLDSADRTRTASVTEHQLPMAVVLRRRFSSQHGRSSSSSGIGTPLLTTSSTDSSMEAGLPPVMFHSADEQLQGRRRTKTAPTSGLPTFSVTCDPHDTVMGAVEMLKELSPVDERHIVDSSSESLDQDMDEEETPHAVSVASSSDGNQSPATVVRRTRATSLRKLSPSSVSKSQSLHLVIPPTSPPRVPPPSPSNSSVSSRDASPGTIGSNELLPIISSLKPPIVIKRGPKGFGFTLRSVRVYLGAESDYFTIQHLITHVDPSSPAFDAGLRPDDLITHVNGDAIQNMTHPELMQRLLSFGEHLNLRVTPIENTSIKTGAARKTAGKMARKKGTHRQSLQRRVLEKKRRASLLRRLSGKRVSTGTDLSSQKQTFIPRSVSSQESIGAPTVMNLETPTTKSVLKRKSDVGIGGAVVAAASPPVAPPSPTGGRPSTLQGLGSQLKHKISSLRPQARRKSSHATTPMPVSPLARAEAAQQPPLPSTSGNGGSVQKQTDTTTQGQSVAGSSHSQTSTTIESTRSPSPLAAGYQSSSSKRGSSSKKTVTKPVSKSDQESSSHSRKGAASGRSPSSSSGKRKP